MMQLKYVLPLPCEVWQAYLVKKKKKRWVKQQLVKLAIDYQIGQKTKL